MTSQRAGLRKTGQDGGRWEYKLGVSAKRSGSIPLGPAHICLILGLEAVGSEVLVSDFTKTIHDTYLCFSFRAELVELRPTFSNRPLVQKVPSAGGGTKEKGTGVLS